MSLCVICISEYAKYIAYINTLHFLQPASRMSSLGPRFGRQS